MGEKSKLDRKDFIMTILVFAIMVCYSLPSLKGLLSIFNIRLGNIIFSEYSLHLLVVEFLFYVEFVVKDEKFYTILYRLAPLLIFYRIVG